MLRSIVAEGEESPLMIFFLGMLRLNVAVGYGSPDLGMLAAYLLSTPFFSSLRSHMDLFWDGVFALGTSFWAMNWTFGSSTWFAWPRPHLGLLRALFSRRQHVSGLECTYQTLNEVHEKFTSFTLKESLEKSSRDAVQYQTQAEIPRSVSRSGKNFLCLGGQKLLMLVER